MADITTVEHVPSPEPQAHLMSAGETARPEPMDSLARLQMFANTNGDISDLLTEAELTELGTKAIREWNMDQGSREDWLERSERYLDIAAQEPDDDDARQPIWENGADIHYPLLTTATQQFAARAYPELVRGDKVVGVKVFMPPQSASPMEDAKGAPPPQNPQQAQMMQAALMQEQQQQSQLSQALRQRNQRARRIAHYLNWLIFYKMDNWEGETDALIHEVATLGSDFKKVYYGERGLQSDFVSSMRLTIHNDSSSFARCPRVTQDFDVYPYEIEDRIRAGIYREIDLPHTDEDEQAPRTFIEQHRLDDLDGDGLAEPYIVTVDQDTQQVLRVEPAFTEADIITQGHGTGETYTPEKVVRIDRWLPYAEFMFLPDPKGRRYGIGFGRLLDSIMDSIDTSLNQLIDAGHAEIAGGGFVASGVRLQDGGQGGAIYMQPGEYKVVSSQGPDLRGAVWERTVPHPSAVTFSLLEFLLAAAKDIASVKDVITGEAPSTAPVGTTLALQQQALQVFSSIYKRVYRGFRDEFRLMFKTQKRYATDEDRREYQELTGGDFDQDFAGDGTDIQPVADPTVVTKMQKVARLQTVIQLAESPLGMAAGMTQPGPAQALVMKFLEDIDYDNPEELVAQVQPNPLEMAEVQDKVAAAAKKKADAAAVVAKIPGEIEKNRAETLHTQSEAAFKIGEVAEQTHVAHKEADRIAQTGSVAAAEDLVDPAEEAEKDREAAAAKKGGE